MKTREQIYQEVVSGYDEPDLMWILGKTLKEMARRLGKGAAFDSDGQPIDDDAMYQVSTEGTFRVQ